MKMGNTSKLGLKGDGSWCEKMRYPSGLAQALPFSIFNLQAWDRQERWALRWALAQKYDSLNV